MAINLNGTGSISGLSSISAPAISGVPAGTASAPAFSFTGDSNTGFYSPGADQVALSTGGTGRLFVDANGNIGIGVSAPSNPLQIEKNGNFTTAIVASNTDTGASSSTNLILYSGSKGVNLAAYGAGSQCVFQGLSGTNLITSAFDTHTWANTAATAEYARIDSSGRFLSGTSTSIETQYSGQAKLQIASTGYYNTSFTQFSNDAFESVLVIGKSRNASVGGHTVLQNGDTIASIRFEGSDGTGFKNAGQIVAQVDGTPGTDDMPGRIIFATTSDGASAPTERARINSLGYFHQSDTGAYIVGSGDYNQFISSRATNANTWFYSTNAALVNPVLALNTVKAGNSDFIFLYCLSSNFIDVEFNLRGDGNAFADGTWTGGGADYAEYFEWSDSNPNAEDRRGISVVLEDDKIREAQAGEDPIGVISGNPSVVGDAAWNKWSGKYLRDEFGTYIQEDYEVEDDDGNIVTQQRRKLNPVYDPNVEYVPREERSEWDCVGLMGKLRIRKGQVTGSRWIKMRDISDSVEEWLVR